MRTPPNEQLSSDIVDSARFPEPGEGDGLPDAGPAMEDGPQRRCILTGEVRPRVELIRLVRSDLGSDPGLVLPDLQARAPGRGAWIGVDRAALEQAQAKGRLKGALVRAFKTGELDIPGDLPDRIEQGLKRLFLDRLGLEKRTGALISGAHAVNDAARGGKLALLLHALDASEDGRRKLDQAWRVGSEREGSGVRGTVLPLDRDALSVALGRENTVHIGITRPASAGRIEGVLDRLLRFIETPNDRHLRSERDTGRAPIDATNT